MDNNKVKYGLQNAYYAVATINDDGTASYGDPVRWPGAVSLSMDAEGDVTKFRADNIDYWVGQSNAGYSGDFESALIPESFRKDVLGEVEDANGIMLEATDALTIPFALMFQFEGDKKATRHVFYNCTASRPSTSGQTTEETIEPQTETVSLTAASIYFPALERSIVKARCSKDEAAYSTWFDAVYNPGGVTVPSVTTYTVTFDSDGGSEVPSQTVQDGQTASEPTEPTKEGATFSGWLLDGEEYDFSTPVTSDITLTAYWTTD